MTTMNSAHQQAQEIYDGIAHGDEEHRSWLHDAIFGYFDGQPFPPPRGSNISASTMCVPEDLRFVVTQLVGMHDAGWEVCGFQGGGSGKVQFHKVEFRRRREVGDA